MLNQIKRHLEFFLAQSIKFAFINLQCNNTLGHCYAKVEHKNLKLFRRYSEKPFTRFSASTSLKHAVDVRCCMLASRIPHLN